MAFKKAGTRKSGVKVIFWGKQGCGKTLAALTFPNIAAIDTENGMIFYEDGPKGKNLVFTDATQDYTEIEQDIDDLIDEHEGVQTLVEDSITKIYENIKEAIMTVEEKKAIKKGRDTLDTNLSVRSWGKINEIVSRLQNKKLDLTSRGVNIVTVAQAKDVKKQVGDQTIKVGETPDYRDKALYDYDIEINFFTETDDDGTVHYKGKVIKDRTEVFKKGDIIENVTYDLWKDRLEGRKTENNEGTSFGKDVENSQKVYEQAVEEEEKSFQERATALLAKWKETGDVDSQTAFKQALAAGKITGFSGLSLKKEEALKEILDKFEA